MLPSFWCTDIDQELGICPPRTESHVVSWQSAFWPVMTLSLALMLQNTGRVCGGHCRDSYALRSSPFVCVIDTSVMLVKFLWMLDIGCPFGVAVRHVWYDRFEVEEFESRSTLDMWMNMFLRTNQVHMSSMDTEVNPRGQNIPVHADSLPTSVGSHQKTSPDQIPLERLVSHKSATKAVVTKGDERCSESTMYVTENSLQEDTSIIWGRHPFMPDERYIEEETGFPEASTSMLNPEYARIYPGSGIDRTWRLNIAGFMLGALPQAIKIFGMKGIPLTQLVVSFQLASFLVTEIFRALAGPAGKVRLHPMPIVINAKNGFAFAQACVLGIGCVFSLVFYIFCFSGIAIFTNGESEKNRLVLIPLVIVALALVVSFAFACIVFVLSELIRRLPSMISSGKRLKKCEILTTVRSKILLFLADLFALDITFLARWLALLIIFPFILIASAWFVACFGSNWDWDSSLALEIIAPWILLFFQAPIVLSILHVLFRLVFMGSLARYPRKLFGMEGTVGEFISVAFVAINLFSVFVSYAYMGWDSKGTYKPGWADSLG